MAVLLSVRKRFWKQNNFNFCKLLYYGTEFYLSKILINLLFHHTNQHFHIIYNLCLYDAIIFRYLCIQIDESLINFYIIDFKWYLHGSNMGHLELQSSALPTELRYHKTNKFVNMVGFEPTQPSSFSTTLYLSSAIVENDKVMFKRLLIMHVAHPICFTYSYFALREGFEPPT